MVTLTSLDAVLGPCVVCLLSGKGQDHVEGKNSAGCCAYRLVLNSVLLNIFINDVEVGCKQNIN